MVSYGLTAKFFDQHMRIELRDPTCIFIAPLASSTSVARSLSKHIPLFRSKRFTISSDLLGKRDRRKRGACPNSFFHNNLASNRAFALLTRDLRL